jgi:SAM-dependent methyltransferase
MKNTVCMNCRGPNLDRFLDLGQQPNGNHFPGPAELGNEPRFPFAMAVCTDCWQVQIEEFPPVEFMFTNHPYITGVNMPVLSHFDRMVDDTLRKFPLRANSLVLDIGANDGTLLKRFQKAGMRVLGIDPGKRTGELARAEGLTVCEAFWDESAASAFGRLGLHPDLITATSVFYHLADIHSFVRGLAKLLQSDGVFLAQCVYLKDVIEKLQFDHFYHEHTMIHAIGPLRRLFGQYGLRMLDVDFYDVHGGSFVLYVGREESPYPTSDSIDRAIRAEEAAGLRRGDTYHEFARRAEANRGELVALLRALKAQGKRIFGLGAPLKGSTLLNYCGIGPDLVELATEVNRFKIGRFTPGTHIPIVYEETIREQPDYYLVLSWNFLDFFVDKYADYLSKGGKFIVPHPEVRVVGGEALRSRVPRAD